MKSSQLATIERIQVSMVEIENDAFSQGMDPVDYVRTKPLLEPTNQEEYILSMAELGIESDIANDDILSWSVEIEDIEESLSSYPEVDKVQTLEQVDDKERELLKQLMNRTPDIKSISKEDKSHDGFGFE